MARIEGFQVKNFKSLKDVKLGRLRDREEEQPLTPVTAVIGKNGVGKSALFDAFGFLADALKSGVEEACDARGRGGFEKIRTQGQAGPIEFEVFYRERENEPSIMYQIIIDMDKKERPYVLSEYMYEILKHGRGIRAFLLLDNGRGNLRKEKQGEAEYDFGVIHLNLEDQRKLGIATLGNLNEDMRVSAFQRFLEGWHLSYFSPEAVRGDLPMAGPQKHLNTRGDNLGNVVQFMEREHPKRFQNILKNIAGKIPGIDRIDTERTSDGRLLLRFNDKGFQDPFYAQQMSDGTLKVFAYLLLLEDPTPPPFLCIEEPENGLYHKLLETLAREFREHSQQQGGSQVFITTHQPYLVDALEPNEVWILEKGTNGFSKIRRASDDPLVNNMVAEGLPLGGLWYSDYLDPR